MKDTLIQVLPHLNMGLNALVAFLLMAGWVAIRRGKKTLHPRLMVSAVLTGVLFLGTYALQVGLTGHKRFPGDDWIRTAFLAMLLSHTILAVAVPPLVLRTLYLAIKGRLEEHKPLARVTFGVWLYVALTGVLVYWMNNHFRPH